MAVKGIWGGDEGADLWGIGSFFTPPKQSNRIFCICLTWPLIIAIFLRIYFQKEQLKVNEKPDSSVIKDRRLGDEWLDWDGSQIEESADTDSRVFLGLAVISTVFLILSAGLFLWLIYPRLLATGEIVVKVLTFAFLAFSTILILWLTLFIIAFF